MEQFNYRISYQLWIIISVVVSMTSSLGTAVANLLLTPWPFNFKRVSITDFLVSETNLMLCKKMLPSVSLNQKQNIQNFNPKYHNLSYCKQTKKTLHHHKQLLWRHKHHAATRENAAGSAATAEEPALVLWSAEEEPSGSPHSTEEAGQQTPSHICPIKPSQSRNVIT